MLDLVRQIVEFYLKNNNAPTLANLNVEDKSILSKQGGVFVTFYNGGKVRGSAGNIRGLQANLLDELIISTVSAIKDDSRFSKITLSESSKLQIRVDEIISMDVLDTSVTEGVKKEDNFEIKKIDPVKKGVIAIDKNYDDLAVILPNISPNLLSGEDFIAVLESKLKLKTKFQEKNYILYSIDTKVETSY